MRAWTNGLLALLASCAANQPLHFSSAPPGAAILVDGEDSGFVTPAFIDLPNPEDSRVEFVLDGYQTAERQLTDERQGELVFWSEASTSAKNWNFPLFLPYKDFFFFYKRANSSRLEQQVRGRIFVRLRRSSDQQ
jgi:hypothetical protein